MLTTLTSPEELMSPSDDQPDHQIERTYNPHQPRRADVTDGSAGSDGIAPTLQPSPAPKS